MVRAIKYIFLFSMISASAALKDEESSRMQAQYAINTALTEYNPKLLDETNGNQKALINVPLETPYCGLITPLSYAVIMGPYESCKFIPHTRELVRKLLAMGANPFIRKSGKDEAYYGKTTLEIVRFVRKSEVTGRYHPDTAETLRAVEQSLAEYEKLALGFSIRFGIPLKICTLLICTADFGLEK